MNDEKKKKYSFLFFSVLDCKRSISDSWIKTFFYLGFPLCTVRAERSDSIGWWNSPLAHELSWILFSNHFRSAFIKLFLQLEEKNWTSVLWISTIKILLYLMTLWIRIWMVLFCSKEKQSCWIIQWQWILTVRVYKKRKCTKWDSNPRMRTYNGLNVAPWTTRTSVHIFVGLYFTLYDTCSRSSCFPLIQILFQSFKN